MAYDEMGTGDGLTQEGNEGVGTPQEEMLDFMGGIDSDPQDGDAEVDTEGEMQEGESEADAVTPTKKFAGMYNSVEELEQAYKKLQTQYQSTKSQAKDLYAQLTEATSSPQAKKSEFSEPRQNNVPDIAHVDPAILAKALQENPAATIKLLTDYAVNQAVAPMRGEMEKTKLQQEITTMKSKYADFESYGDSVAQVLKENPYLANTPNRLEIAYKMAKADAMEQVAQRAVANGIKQGYAQASQKKAIQTGGQATGSAKGKPSTPEDAIFGDMFEVVKNRNSIF